MVRVVLVEGRLLRLLLLRDSMPGSGDGMLALPVERGVKHAANLWMHLYDFKTPSRSGLCPFLGQNTNP